MTSNSNILSNQKDGFVVTIPDVNISKTNQNDEFIVTIPALPLLPPDIKLKQLGDINLTGIEDGFVLIANSHGAPNTNNFTFEFTPPIIGTSNSILNLGIGQMQLVATNNNTVTLWYRGTDGISRFGDIPLIEPQTSNETVLITVIL